MHDHRDHAIVLGASIAGLLAARVLAGHFRCVTLIERDSLPATPEARRGVPQGAHTHGVLAAGVEVLERRFPGLTANLVEVGVRAGDPGLIGQYIVQGCRVRKCSTGLGGLPVSRLRLEHELRSRVLAMPNVEVRSRTIAVGLLSNRDNSRVTGVAVRNRGADTNGHPDESELKADLVVDTTGRGSRSPVWLQELGYVPPPEDRLEVGVSYTTAVFARQPDDLDGDVYRVIGAVPPAPHAGAAIAVEGERWIVTLGGYLGIKADREPAAFTEFARHLAAPDIYEVIRDREPLQPVITMTCPTTLRRRYERLRRFPEGLLVFGDAICSFNPIYGQGISVAAKQADALDRWLGRGRAGSSPRRFFAAAARAVDPAWELTVGGDLEFDEIEGPRTVQTRLTSRYLTRLLAVARNDEQVARAFLGVINLTTPPQSLLHPRVSRRVLAARRRAPGSHEWQRGTTPRRDALDEPDRHVARR